MFEVKFIDKWIVEWGHVIRTGESVQFVIEGTKVFNSSDVALEFIYNVLVPEGKYAWRYNHHHEARGALQLPTTPRKPEGEQ